MRKYIITALLTLLLNYLAFAFVKADLNAFNWDEYLRGFCMLLSLFLCGASVFFFAMFNLHLYKK
jgi:hypothetical protein